MTTNAPARSSTDRYLGEGDQRDQVRRSLRKLAEEHQSRSSRSIELGRPARNYHVAAP